MEKETIERYRINREEQKLLEETLYNHMNNIPIDFETLIPKLSQHSSNPEHWNISTIKKWIYNAISRQTTSEKISMLTETTQKKISTIKKIAPPILSFNKSILHRKNIKQTNSGYHVYYKCEKCNCSITFKVSEGGLLVPIEKYKHTTCFSESDKELSCDQFLRIKMLAKAEEKVMEGVIKGPRNLLNSMIFDKTIDAPDKKKIEAITINDCRNIINENTEKVEKYGDVTIPEKAAVMKCGSISIPFLKFHLLHPCVYIGFACPKQEELLRETTNIFIDGTFDVRPKEFKTQKGQLLNFLIWDPVTNVYIPVLHVLMNGRKEYDYTILFKIIDVFFEIKKVTDVYVDFEFSISNSLEKWRPGINIHKCFFHYTQCLVRKMKELYLNYENSTGKLLLKILKQLPFYDISMRIMFIIQMRDINSKEINQMLEYYVSNWIEKYFILDYSTNEPLTNNGCECFHSELSNLIKAKTPSIEELSISLFTLFQSRTTLRASYLLPHAPIRKMKTFAKLKVDDLINLIRKLPGKIEVKGTLTCRKTPVKTTNLDSLQSPIF